MLWLIDDKNWYWSLVFSLRYKASEKGLVETWCAVSTPVPKALAGYYQIPVPVFTDWWETNGRAQSLLA